MSTLTVNLKQLYQRRGLLLLYLALGFFAFLSIVASFEHPVAGEGKFTGLIVMALVVGLFLAVLPIEVLSKPFSYCLPGHRKVVGRFIFCVGAAFNFLGSLLFLRYPGLNSWQLVLVACSAFSGGLILYWLGVGLAVSVRNSGAWIGLLPLVIFGGLFFDLHIVIERVIVGNPFVVILVGVLSSVLAWLWLDNADLARRYCGVPGTGSLDVWNPYRMKRYCQIRMAAKWDKLKKHPSPWVETFFLGRMNRYDHSSTGRYIWGGLYTTFGIALSQWKAAFSGMFLALVIVGYMGSGRNILFIILGLMVVQMRLPVYSNMLISGGRNEKYRCAMTLVITTAVLITILVTIVAALSLPLATIMPDITLRGSTFTFHAMNIELFFIPLLMIPIVFTIQLICYRKPISMVVSIMLLFMLLFSTSNFWHEQLISSINPMFIIGGLVLSWVLFTLVLRYICMRRCLVGQG
ncbi:MAG: hypothetical protein ACYTDW_08845 [Planctomycetota bacterium]|jgi:hypothetical protein